jgi:4-amino-4-deoxy-L-arabinose transferase-like glycosyltransferase
MAQTNETQDETLQQRGDQGYRVLLALTLIYFMVFALLMTTIGGQPDQTKHTYYSIQFGNSWGIPPEDHSGFYITGNTFLYYWMNGVALKLYRFLATGDSFSTDGGIYLLRLLSVLISTTTVFYIYKLASSITGNKYAGVLASFFMSNTIMFVFLSGGITYDNLMNLSSIAALYHLVNVYRGDDYIKNTALIGIWLGISSLAKQQALLLALIIFLIWLLYSFKSKKHISLNFSRANKIWVLISTVVLVVFTGFYGSNLIRYHRPIPDCAQVKLKEYCTNFQEREQYKQPLNIRRAWDDREPIFDYAFSWWPDRIIRSIWGIVSHKSYAPQWIAGPHEYLILWAFVCMLLYWRRQDTLPALLLIILASYITFIFFLNLKNELIYDFRHFAVQGRYLFPVIPALITLMVTYFLRIRPLLLRNMVLSLSIILYFSTGLGLFIFKYPEVFIFWSRLTGGN